jgi:hypothetical protein
MCTVTHVAAGALIGSLLDDRLIAFLVGFASHIPLDLIPHVDFKDFRVDAAMSVSLLGGILLLSGFSPLLLGALGAVAPDFENLLWKTGVLPERHKIFPTHSGLISHGRSLVGKGVVTEVTMFALSLGIVALAMLIRGGGN